MEHRLIEGGCKDLLQMTPGTKARQVEASDEVLPRKKRSLWLSALVLGAGVVAVCCVLLVVGAAYWWRANGAQVSQELQTARRDGEAAGSGRDYQGCLNLATARIKDLSGPMALVVGNSFLGGCMETAAEPPGFCDVPADVFGIRRWRQQRCEVVPADAKDSCVLLVGSVQQLCKAHHQPKS
jgi:hypothetical protein